MTRAVERVVSLLPAGTEIVAALGALEQLVAVSHECDYPPEVLGLPRVTASAVDRDADSATIDATVRSLAESGVPVFAIAADDIVRLQPTLILTQSLCEVCAVSSSGVGSLSQLLSPAPTVLPLVGSTLDGVWSDMAAVATALGRKREVESLVSSINERLLRVHHTLKTARAPRRRVVVIEWLDPLFVAGHWTPDVVRRGGGIDALAQSGQHSVQITVEEVRDAKPELLLFAPCGFDVERAERESRALLATEDWGWAREIDAWALDGNALTSRPGPRLADAVEVIASIIAPHLFATPNPAYARRVRTPALVPS